MISRVKHNVFIELDVGMPKPVILTEETSGSEKERCPVNLDLG